MARTLTPDEKRKRRQERLRLIAFLHRGGRLVREDLPAGVTAWSRASRSGHPFSDRCVTRLRKRGCMIRGEAFAIDTDEHGFLAMGCVAEAEE